jgi:hypothetical protein
MGWSERGKNLRVISSLELIQRHDPRPWMLNFNCANSLGNSGFWLGNITNPRHNYRIYAKTSFHLSFCFCYCPTNIVDYLYEPDVRVCDSPVFKYSHFFLAPSTSSDSLRSCFINGMTRLDKPRHTCRKASLWSLTPPAVLRWIMTYILHTHASYMVRLIKGREKVP